MTKIELSDGKYTVINELSEGGGFRALRYGEEWRDLAGDNLIHAMFCEIERLMEIVENEIPCAVCLAPIDHLWKFDDGEVICGKCAEVRRIDENIY